ncbi:MAG: ABC transporter permease, partial [Tissierellia bacterium]|nr:ABC transporter permease [Tissierellia bacterium]
MRILKYISKRVLMLIITMLVLITIIFFLFRILPGNPVSMYIDSGLDRESQELLLKHYGLDKPYLQQYII